MTARDRFLATIRFEPLDRPLKWEAGYWPDTLRQWAGEGLTGKADADFAEQNELRDSVWRLFDFDEYYAFIPIQTRHLQPGFPEEVLEDHDSWQLIRNRNGAIEKVLSENEGIRAIVRGAVQNREDWERIKAEHLQPVLEDRVAGDLDAIIEGVRNGTRPIRGIQCEPWLNLGELLGLDELLYNLAADPEFAHLMIRDLTEFFLSLTDQLLKRIVPDICWLGGDFCFKSGPMMSPEMFRTFLLPSFKEIAGLYRDYGVPCVMIHTDGDQRSLLPHFIEAGATGSHPFEVTNCQLITEVRDAYPRFHIFGGLDKQAIARGPASIDAELESKLPTMLAGGGYIPYMDHSVPPSVSWQNYRYYRTKLAELTRLYPFGNPR